VAPEIPLKNPAALGDVAAPVGQDRPAPRGSNRYSVAMYDLHGGHVRRRHGHPNFENLAH